MMVFCHCSLLCGRFSVFPCHVAFTDCCVGPLVLSPMYLLPNMMWLRLFGDMLNSAHTSLAVPSFMYFHRNCNHRAATSSLVGLFLGSCTILAESEWGSNFLSNFCLMSSAVEVGLGSCTRLRYLSGMLIWTSSLTTALRTRSNI